MGYHWDRSLLRAGNPGTFARKALMRFSDSKVTKTAHDYSRNIILISCIFREPRTTHAK